MLENKLFVINKEDGPTSFDIVDAFRRVTGVRKVGHAGTLDPLARGVLLLCTGRATRAVEHFMNLEKVYEFDVHLGSETTTLDAEGEVVAEKPCPDFDDETIRSTARSFVGRYELEPPAYSAIKKNGRRLYELARAGEDTEVEPRIVRIEDVEVLSIQLPDVRLRVRCGRGTYVRSLARDFGARLDMPAHIRKLVRTAVGPFRIEDAFPSEKIFARDTSGIEGIDLSSALQFLPSIVLRSASTRALIDGALPNGNDVLRMDGGWEESRALRILDESGRLLAIGNRDIDGERRRQSLIDSFRLLVDRGA